MHGWRSGAAQAVPEQHRGRLHPCPQTQHPQLWCHAVHLLLPRLPPPPPRIHALLHGALLAALVATPACALAPQTPPGGQPAGPLTGLERAERKRMPGPGWAVPFANVIELQGLIAVGACWPGRPRLPGVCRRPAPDLPHGLRSRLLPRLRPLRNLDQLSRPPDGHTQGLRKPGQVAAQSHIRGQDGAVLAGPLGIGPAAPAAVLSAVAVAGAAAPLAAGFRFGQ